MKTTLAIVLGLSLAVTAQAQTGTINQLFAFTCFGGSNNDKCPEGARPNTIIQASDGNFYGGAEVTDDGVSFPEGGTLFKVTPSGQFTRLFTFAQATSGKFLNGDLPVSGLAEGNDGLLYGTTVLGGSHNDGVLFRVTKSGRGFTVLHNFCSSANCADGNGPGSLLLGQDGNIYGTTLEGGSSTGACQTVGCGTIFRFEPATTSFATVHTLNGTTDGTAPAGVILASDGNFYGVDSAADVNSSVFRFIPGTAQFTVLFTLPEFDIGLNGLAQAGNGNLYGAFESITAGEINFFEVSTNGTGFLAFAPFTALAGTINIPSLFLASDGNLWDTNFTDSVAPSGSVFSISPQDGAVLQTFPFDGANGNQPDASVIQGADGKIVGTTELGGTISGGGQRFADGTVWTLDAGLPAPAPALALLNPRSGSAGSTVLINGNNFVGATGVSFNGVSASFKVLNIHFISATVPAGATSGPVTVTNGGGSATSTQSFTVNEFW